MSGRDRGQKGQAVVETIFMIIVLTLLLSAIIQIFLVHNYAFQMANNAYYSLFKDKAYKNDRYDVKYQGPPNYPLKKPLRAVEPWPPNGRVYTQSQGRNWEDDRASVPMMPFYKDAIIDQMKRGGITREPVRLKIGQYQQGVNWLNYKFMHIGAGTDGSYLLAIVDLVDMLIRDLSWLGGGGNYQDYTMGQDIGSLGSSASGGATQQSNMGSSGNLQDGDGNQRSMYEAYDFHHGDYNRDGKNDITGESTNRPWEDQQGSTESEGTWRKAW